MTEIALHKREGHPLAWCLDQSSDRPGAMLRSALDALKAVAGAAFQWGHGRIQLSHATDDDVPWYIEVNNIRDVREVRRNGGSGQSYGGVPEAFARLDDACLRGWSLPLLAGTGLGWHELTADATVARLPVPPGRELLLRGGDVGEGDHVYPLREIEGEVWVDVELRHAPLSVRIRPSFDHLSLELRLRWSAWSGSMNLMEFLPWVDARSDIEAATEKLTALGWRSVSPFDASL